MGRMILSIDVGTKNLAMCVYDPLQRCIRNWEVAGIPTESTNGLYPCLLNHVRDRPWIVEGITMALIERQPDKNKTMKSVENFLYAYLLICNVPCQLYDARHKVPDVSGPGKEMYRKRKAESVVRARAFLVETGSTFLKHFDGTKKKDDLADTLMQALSYTPTPEEDSKVPKPRKPTPNQTRTKYSRSNLAWFVQNPEKMDDRFEKDLKRYYRDVQELRDEFGFSNS